MRELPPISDVSIKTYCGRVIVRGYDLGLFAVTPDLNIEEDGWTVTHLPTGYVCTTAYVSFPSAAAAAFFAERLEREVDMPWESVDPDDFNGNGVRVRPAVVRLALESGAVLTDADQPEEIRAVVDAFFDKFRKDETGAVH